MSQHFEEHAFGYWLRRKRKSLDLTRESLAAQVTCSVSTIRKLEDEERRPSAQIAERLADIFNIPAKERADFLRFARGEWKASPGAVREDIAWQVSGPRSNLPVVPTSLIGREQEAAVIRAYLLDEDIHLVTLVGPPGIGKTRLSIEVAQAVLSGFPDGVFFIPLAPLSDPALIALTVAQALGYVGARDISSNEQLSEAIGNKRMLLVLDNCEHLIEGAASLTSHLLSVCPHLKILATSRESLRIAGEWQYPVPALKFPEQSSSIEMNSVSSFPALTLFAERARTVKPDFVLDAGNIGTVSAICARLDGLPLVIELIAARMRLMSPHALLANLSHQFILSADGMRAPSTRQKTLNDAIDWSYHLLTAEEQQLFDYLAVFSGGFTLDAAEFISSGKFSERPVRDLITSLLDKSLIQLDSARELSDEPRYTMLVTIREFARERLPQMGAESEVQNRHMAYFLELAAKANRELRGPNQLEWLQRLHLMRDNLRAALDWAMGSGQAGAVLQIVRELNWFWVIRSEHTEGRQWLQRALEMPETPLHPAAHSEILANLAHHTLLQIRPLDAKPYAEQALAIARAHQDKYNEARALQMLGLMLTDETDFVSIHSILTESQILFRELHNEWEYALTVFASGWAAYWQQDWLNSLTQMEHGLAILRQFGDRYLISVALSQIGMTHIKMGDLHQGKKALQEALELAQQLDSKYEIASDVWRLGDVALQTENWIRAVHLLVAARNLYESIGAWQPEDHEKLENFLAPCRAMLSESAFVEAVEQGHLMTMEQAVAFALENGNA